MLCSFLLCSKVSQLYVCISLCVGFPSHVGHHRALSRAPCAVWQVLLSSLFYIQYKYTSVYTSVPGSRPIPKDLPKLNCRKFSFSIITQLYRLILVNSIILFLETCNVSYESSNLLIKLSVSTSVLFVCLKSSVCPITFFLLVESRKL